jgi:hypothetical protein
LARSKPRGLLWIAKEENTYIDPHEDVMLLLIANGELALRLLVVLGEML